MSLINCTQLYLFESAQRRHSATREKLCKWLLSRNMVCLGISVASFIGVSLWSNVRVASVVLGAIGVHELGHWYYLKRCHVSASIVILPIGGITIGRSGKNGQLALSMSQYGWFMLSGSLLSVVPLILAQWMGLHQYAGFAAFGALLCILNLYNLCLPFSLADGGRLGFMLISSRWRTPCGWAMNLAGGAILLALGSWFWAILLVSLSLLTLAPIKELFDKHPCDDRTTRERLRLVGGWVGTVGLNLLGLLGSAPTRNCALYLLSGMF